MFQSDFISKGVLPSFYFVINEKENLCWLGFGNDEAKLKKEAEQDLKAPIAKGRLQAVAEKIQKGDTKSLKLYLEGTPFQKAVWAALLKIPKGKTVSYQDIANTIGNPKAVRAVGSAVGANPISLIVPCHRVIKADGKIHNYRWGVDIKKQLLQQEGALS